MIGKRLREERKKKNFTLQELAEMTGFTASYISQIERDLIEPSITALRKLCVALDQKIYFFLDDAPLDPIIVRRDKRQKLKLHNTSISYEFISPMRTQSSYNPQVEVIQIDIQPKEWSSTESFSHKADEIVYILRGELTVLLNSGEEERTEILNSGDSLYILPNVKHRLYNASDEITRILSIITPPIY
jgi:transcriptional regulator with XRE-family HTH domain